LSERDGGLGEGKYAVSKSYEELVTEAKAETEQIGAEEARREAEAGATILDVREGNEYEEAHIEGAKLLPRDLLEYKAADELPDKDARIVVHCALGGRGALAAKSLKEMGYTNVANLDGGLTAWREAGYDVVAE